MRTLPVPTEVLEADDGVYPGIGIFSIEEWMTSYIETGLAQKDWQERTEYWRKELEKWSYAFDTENVAA